ncbi:hypothetical protein [Kibdelosporangium philippinense]|uniref:hypothetical protein n=1 Tax=Kibdelosporangium philippinense TaxID=211113 RepID=UPI0036072B83
MGAGLAATYSYGPGEIRDMVIRAGTSGGLRRKSTSVRWPVSSPAESAMDSASRRSSADDVELP